MYDKCSFKFFKFPCIFQMKRRNIALTTTLLCKRFTSYRWCLYDYCGCGSSVWETAGKSVHWLQVQTSTVKKFSAQQKVMAIAKPTVMKLLLGLLSCGNWIFSMTALSVPLLLYEAIVKEFFQRVWERRRYISKSAMGLVLRLLRRI